MQNLRARKWRLIQQHRQKVEGLVVRVEPAPLRHSGGECRHAEGFKQRVTGRGADQPEAFRTIGPRVAGIG
ncbi:hypothetical protein D3C75_878170 [compost metagenome]